MEKLLKGDSKTPIEKPASGDHRALERQKSVESGIQHTRSRVGKSVKKQGVNAKLDFMRIGLLEKMTEILSKWDVQRIQIKAIIGKDNIKNGLNWADIRTLMDHILLRWKSIYSRVPNRKHMFKKLMEKDVDPKDVDQAYIEVAQFFGFRDYDEMTSAIELGEKSENKG